MQIFTVSLIALMAGVATALLDSRLSFAHAFFDEMAIRPPLGSYSTLRKMQQWTDIGVCYSWYALYFVLINFRFGWAPKAKLDELNGRDFLWDCLKTRGIVKDHDDPYAWTRPVDLGFGDDDLHRVFRVRGKLLVAVRFSRFGTNFVERNLAESYLLRSGADWNVERWARARKIPFANALGWLTGKVVNVVAWAKTLYVRWFQRADLFPVRSLPTFLI
jgi:hypothetical protein